MRGIAAAPDAACVEESLAMRQGTIDGFPRHTVWVLARFRVGDIANLPVTRTVPEDATCLRVFRAECSYRGWDAGVHNW